MRRFPMDRKGVLARLRELRAGRARRNPTIETYTGTQFTPLDPDWRLVNPVDIAHSLAQKCRYTGHTLRHYSVAEHCCILHDFFGRRGMAIEAAWALFHDGAEAYLPDVAGPIKPGLAGFDALEARVEKAVATRFALPPRMPEAVLLLDKEIVYSERTRLMRPVSWWENYPDPALDAELNPVGWTAERARQEWLLRFSRLVGLREVVG